MVKIVKHQTDDGSIDYEFVGFDYWDDFDSLAEILTQQFNATVTDKIEGVYSRYWTIVINDVKFRLMYHEDTGNCLCPVDKADSIDDFLNDLAQKMLPFVNQLLKK